jgi:hypothetical protein
MKPSWSPEPNISSAQLKETGLSESIAASEDEASRDWMLIFSRSSEFWVRVPARVALPVFATLKSVVVAFAVEEATTNTLELVSPLSAFTYSFAPGAVPAISVPIPTFPLSSMYRRSTGLAEPGLDSVGVVANIKLAAGTLCHEFELPLDSVCELIYAPTCSELYPSAVPPKLMKPRLNPAKR